MGMLAKLFKALNSESSAWQLAFGIALGAIMGLTPWLGLHSLILLFVVLFFRINLSTFIVAWAGFTLLALPLNASFSELGHWLLMLPSLQGLWTFLYSTYLGQLSQFYHTLTLGSLVASLLLFPILLLGSKKLVDQYRQRLMLWVNQWRIVEFLKGSNFYQLYRSLGA
ncbi:TIGR03546 family protein [Paraglaciecola aestuariivivens]